MKKLVLCTLILFFSLCGTNAFALSYTFADIVTESEDPKDISLIETRVVCPEEKGKLPLSCNPRITRPIRIKPMINIK